MRLSVLECPKCKGELEIKDDREVIYCEYCGTQIFLQHSKAEQESYVKVKQMEHERKLKEMEYENKRQKAKAKADANNKELKYGLIAMFGLFGICFLMIIIMPLLENGFSDYDKKESTTQNLTIQNFTFDLPDYWDEEGSDKDIKQYYAKNEDSEMVMLSIAYPKETDKKYDVSYEGLEKDNSNMIKSFESTYKDCGVYNNETYENKNGVKGILYSFNYVQKIDWFTKEDATGYCFVFPSEDDRRWFYVTFLCTNNVDDSTYKDDFMDMLATITEKTVKENETTITTTATTKDTSNKFLDEIFGDK